MSTYWEKRAQESVGRWENAVNQKTKEMAQAFEEAKKAIEGEIYSFYGRYAKNNQITMEEAKKALSRKELAEFKGTLAEYERLARNSIGTFNLEVENLSMKARLIRLDALMLQIDGELQRLYQQLREDIAETAEKVLIEEYYHTQYNLSVEAGRLLAFSKIPKDFIEQVLAYPIAGADISTRLWKQGADTSFFIRQTLNRMFIEGRPPQDFAEELAKKIGAVQIDKEGRVTGGGKKYEAYRLLYNEASYATNQADLRSYEEDEVPYYDIVAKLDTKTSPMCRSLDGCRFSVTSGGKVPEEYKKAGSQYRQEAYNTDRVIVGINFPPFHVNCRTNTSPAYETTDIASMSRAARDANGKYITVPASMTYEEWYETYIIGPNVVKNSNGHDILIVKKTMRTAAADSITQVINEKGGVSRNYYDSAGNWVKQITNNNHGNSKKHPFGKNGEHVHDIVWKDGKIVSRIPRELTDEEREENADIL